MSKITKYIEQQIKLYGKQVLKKRQERRLKPGEVGWGKPKHLSAGLESIGADKKLKVAVIGLGPQGYKQCTVIAGTPGLQLVGVADMREDRLQKAAQAFKLPEQALFTDAAAMIRANRDLDLLSVATTAGAHVKLGRLAIVNGVKRIIIEKPLDTSLIEARAFIQEAKDAGVELVINYSRRWVSDYVAVKRAVSQGYIGSLRSICVSAGAGELAMIGSHWFDLCCWLFDDTPAEVYSKLEAVHQPNRREGNYHDPYGFCHITFKNGQRAYVDFSSDYKRKSFQLMLTGDSGHIFIDEAALHWNLQSDGQLMWQVPFNEALTSANMFSNVLVAALNGRANALGDSYGLDALEIVFGAHISDREQRPVQVPLSKQEAALEVNFP